MKVNFNRPFLDFKGDPIMKELSSKGKKQLVQQLIKDVISSLLFDGAWRHPLSVEEKLHAYDLSVRIFQSIGDMEITVEDAVLVKEAAQLLSPGGFAQIVKLIDG